MNNYPQVVEQIHNEFNMAGEKLLQESLAIIEKAEKIDVTKAHLLKTNGFTNNELVKKADKIQSNILEPTTVANIVLQYKRIFPLHKFIISSDVDKICKKYNLKKGFTEQYTGFVPQKNLSDIVAFKSAYSGRLKKRLKINKLKVSALFSGSLNRLFNPKCRHVKNFVVKNNGVFWVDTERELVNLLNATSREIKKDCWFEINSMECVELSIFDICAPEKDMLSNSVFDKMFPKFQMEVIPDPVVLYPVEHGYIIVTAWGDEASDPLVVNEQMN